MARGSATLASLDALLAQARARHILLRLRVDTRHGFVRVERQNPRSAQWDTIIEWDALPVVYKETQAYLAGYAHGESDSKLARG